MRPLVAAAAGAVSLAILTSCSSAGDPGQVTAKTGSASPAPTVSSSSSDVIAAAVSGECSGFQGVYSQVQADTPVGAPVLSSVGREVLKHSSAWARVLNRAAAHANDGGVPDGGNKARSLAVQIDRAALHISNADLAAETGNPLMMLRQFTGFLNTVNRIDSGRCADA